MTPTDLQRLIEEIDLFEERTQADSYTDVGEAWELLIWVREMAQKGLKDGAAVQLESARESYEMCLADDSILPPMAKDVVRGYFHGVFK